MLALPPNARIFLAIHPIDMRRSFDGLAAHVKHHMRQNPLSGHLYVFLNRRRTLMKVLFFDRSGYCILYKRLEQGTFQRPEADSQTGRVELTAAELALILEGIDLRHIKRRSGPAKRSTPRAGRWRPRRSRTGWGGPRAC